jgi:hemolysin activation/secretion protein
LKLGGWLAPWIRDRLQFYVFCDYGYVQVRKPPALVGNELGSTLASVGPGLRYNINTFLSVQLDCGYQLVRDPALIDQAGVNRSPWQGNISVIASF